MTSNLHLEVMTTNFTFGTSKVNNLLFDSLNMLLQSRQ